MKVRFVVLLILLLSLSLLTPTSIADGLGSRNLRLGMRGADVELLQEYLFAAGYPVAVDGIFGAETDAAVRRFQRDQNLAVDGIVGPQTIAALQAGIAQLQYIVKAGDTLSHIARSYGVSVQELIEANQLTSTVIYPGQKLVIPGFEQEYVVRSGENLSVIAQKFGLSAADLAEYNSISDPNRIQAGQLLTIPTSARAVPAVSRTKSPPKFIWPVSGRISSPYGWRNHPITNIRHFHGGIDIAAPEGTIVRAAASGRVIQAEWMGDYGYGVVIDHGGGYTTWYGHNSQLLVRKGDLVNTNQPIARVGSTGVSTGPHLDFRIKYHNETVNPLDFLL